MATFDGSTCSCAAAAELDALKRKHTDVVDKFRVLIDKQKAAISSARDAELKVQERDEENKQLQSRLDELALECAKLQHLNAVTADEREILLTQRNEVERERTETRHCAEQLAEACSKLDTLNAYAARQAEGLVSSRAACEAAEARARIAEQALAEAETAVRSAAATSAAVEEGKVSALEAVAASLQLRLSAEMERCKAVEASEASEAERANRAEAAGARMKQLLVKQQGVMKALQIVDAARNAVPDRFALLSNVRLPPSLLTAAINLNIPAKEADVGPVEARDDGCWCCVTRWDGAGGVGQGAASEDAGARSDGAASASASPSRRMRVEWVLEGVVRDWLGGGATQVQMDLASLARPLLDPHIGCGSASSSDPSSSFLVSDALCASLVALCPGGAGPPGAGPAALATGEAFARLMAIVHSAYADRLAALTSSLRAHSVESGVVREELASHKRRAGEVVRAAEARAQAAEAEARGGGGGERVNCAGIMQSGHGVGVDERADGEAAAREAEAEARVRVLTDRLSAQQRRADAAESSCAALRRSVQEQADRFGAELEERERTSYAAGQAAGATVPSPLLPVPSAPSLACAECASSLAALERVQAARVQMQERCAVLEGTLAARGPAHVQGPEWGVPSLPPSRGPTPTPLDAPVPWDGAVPAAPPAIPIPMDAAARASALLDRLLTATGSGEGGVGTVQARARGQGSARKGRSGGGAGRARGSSSDMCSPPALSPRTRAHVSSSPGAGREPWSATPGPALELGLPTVRSSGDLSRDERDFEEDLAVEEAELMSARLAEAECELRVARAESSRWEAEASALREAVREADRAKQRAETLLGQNASSPSRSATASSASSPTVSLEYLKNAVVRYMASGSATERASMLPAISLLLRLAPGEMTAIQAQLVKDGAAASPVPNKAGRGVIASLFG